MKHITNFVNLFHRKQRGSASYNNLSSLKKYLFLGVCGSVILLSFNKFIQADLQYAFAPTQQNQLLIKLNPPLQRSIYNPSLPMILGVFQHLYARYIQEEVYIRTKDQQFNGQKLYWVQLHDKATHSSKSKKIKHIPIVLVIAGSQGNDNTFKNLMLTGYNLGFQVVGIEPKDLFDQQKIDQIVGHIKKQYPQSKMYGIGVEYGANLLINYASKRNQVFQGLVSVGNPFDLTKSEIALQKSWLWYPLYRQIFESRLKAASALNPKLQTKQISSLFQLDKKLYNIQQNTYEQWKVRNSSINSIVGLQVNSLFIQSKEDPFTQPIDDQRFENEKCLYVITQRGGHNEWYQNLWMNRWLNAPVRYFLKIKNQDQLNLITGKRQ